MLTNLAMLSSALFSDGFQDNVIANLAPGADGGCIWRLQQATKCWRRPCIIHFIMSRIRENQHAILTALPLVALMSTTWEKFTVKAT